MTSAPEESSTERFWEDLEHLTDIGDSVAAAALLDQLSAEEQRYALSHIEEETQKNLVELLTPESAAELLVNLPEAQATSILEDISPAKAADVVQELPEDIGADLLREMDDEETEALLAEIDDAEDAVDLRERLSYEWDTAGGLMTTEYASFPANSTVGDVLQHLGDNAEHYGDMDVQYVYVIDERNCLMGVLRLRDLVLTPRKKPVIEIMIGNPVSVSVSSNFEELLKLFSEKSYLGLPVVDEAGVLKGVVTKETLQEASADHQTEDYLYSAGILGGEELRSMPMFDRSRRRLAWLGPNILLNLIAASIIAIYQDTLQAVIALAVFLPIISDMSGCSGNQAVAVSMRELTLGVIRENEFLRIVWKEGVLGLINGTVLGILLGTIAAVWKTNIWLGLVVMGALMLNTLLSVLLGGMIPLLMKRFKFDPALASGPILTTCTDMCGFFLVLNLASLMLTKLA